MEDLRNYLHELQKERDAYRDQIGELMQKAHNRLLSEISDGLFEQFTWKVYRWIQNFGDGHTRTTTQIIPTEPHPIAFPAFMSDSSIHIGGFILWISPYNDEESTLTINTTMERDIEGKLRRVLGITVVNPEELR